MLSEELRLALNDSPTPFYLPCTEGTFVFTLILFFHILPVSFLTISRYHTNHQQFRKLRLRNIILEATAISEKCLEATIWEKDMFPKGDKANS